MLHVFCNHGCIRNHVFNMDLKHVAYLRPNLILGNNRKLQEANSSDEEASGGMAILLKLFFLPNVHPQGPQNITEVVTKIYCAQPCKCQREPPAWSVLYS